MFENRETGIETKTVYRIDCLSYMLIDNLLLENYKSFLHLTLGKK